MRGSGHFALGFVAGLLVFWALLPWTGTRWRIHGPLLAFALGAWAALPYAFELAGLAPWLTEGAAGWIFFFYPGLQRSAWLARRLRPFWATTGLVAVAYSCIVVHYLLLIRRLRHAQ